MSGQSYIDVADFLIVSLLEPIDGFRLPVSDLTDGLILAVSGGDSNGGMIYEEAVFLP